MSRIVQILVPTGLLLLVAVLWAALVLAAAQFPGRECITISRA